MQYGRVSLGFVFAAIASTATGQPIAGTAAQFVTLTVQLPQPEKDNVCKGKAITINQRIGPEGQSSPFVLPAGAVLVVSGISTTLSVPGCDAPKFVGQAFFLHNQHTGENTRDLIEDAVVLDSHCRGSATTPYPANIVAANGMGLCVHGTTNAIFERVIVHGFIAPFWDTSRTRESPGGSR